MATCHRTAQYTHTCITRCLLRLNAVVQRYLPRYIIEPGDHKMSTFYTRKRSFNLISFTYQCTWNSLFPLDHLGWILYSEHFRPKSSFPRYNFYLHFARISKIDFSFFFLGRWALLALTRSVFYNVPFINSFKNSNWHLRLQKKKNNYSQFSGMRLELFAVFFLMFRHGRLINHTSRDWKSKRGEFLILFFLMECDDLIDSILIQFSLSLFNKY